MQSTFGLLILNNIIYNPEATINILSNEEGDKTFSNSFNFNFF
jgi:hypothetical protein